MIKDNPRVTLQNSSLLIMTRLFSVALFIVVVFFWCGGAIAATHEHHMTIPNSISPFDQKKGGSLLHCALKGHPIDQICPEMSLNDAVGEQISADCGNHTSGANSDAGASSSISLLTSNIRSQNGFLPTSQQINLYDYDTDQLFSQSIDHPPQDVI